MSTSCSPSGSGLRAVSKAGARGAAGSVLGESRHFGVLLGRVQEESPTLRQDRMFPGAFHKEKGFHPSAGAVQRGCLSPGSTSVLRVGGWADVFRQRCSTHDHRHDWGSRLVKMMVFHPQLLLPVWLLQNQHCGIECGHGSDLTFNTLQIQEGRGISC